MKKWRIGYYWVIVEDPSIDNSYTKKYSEELNIVEDLGIDNY